MLKILRHKSWHVWNDDNVEKVKRDERKAADEKAALATRAVAAEAEARLDKLRSRASGGPVATDADEDDDGLERSTPSIAPPGRGSGGNPEYEAERTAAEAKARRTSGIVDYTFKDVTKARPWYDLPRDPSAVSATDSFGKPCSGEVAVARVHRSHAFKDASDPLAAMRRQLEATHRAEDRKHASHSSSSSSGRVYSHGEAGSSSTRFGPPIASSAFPSSGAPSFAPLGATGGSAAVRSSTPLRQLLAPVHAAIRRHEHDVLQTHGHDDDSAATATSATVEDNSNTATDDAAGSNFIADDEKWGDARDRRSHHRHREHRHRHRLRQRSELSARIIEHASAAADASTADAATDLFASANNRRRRAVDGSGVCMDSAAVSVHESAVLLVPGVDSSDRRKRRRAADHDNDLEQRQQTNDSGHEQQRKSARGSSPSPSDSSGRSSGNRHHHHRRRTTSSRRRVDNDDSAAEQPRRHRHRHHGKHHCHHHGSSSGNSSSSKHVISNSDSRMHRPISSSPTDHLNSTTPSANTGDTAVAVDAVPSSASGATRETQLQLGSSMSATQRSQLRLQRLVREAVESERARSAMEMKRPVV